jgi:hypothetical protein
MGLTLVKSKRVTCSNWAASHLSMQQVKYASLDAFVTGQVFRGLRLWHSSPSPCPGCLHPVGSDMSDLEIKCSGCSTKFKSLQAYALHAKITGHPQSYAVCSACGRVCEKAPAGPAAGSPPPAQPLAEATAVEVVA